MTLFGRRAAIRRETKEASLLVIGADIMTVPPLAVRKGERLSGKSQSYRKGDTGKQYLHDCLPTFRWVHNLATLSFIQ